MSFGITRGKVAYCSWAWRHSGNRTSREDYGILYWNSFLNSSAKGFSYIYPFQYQKSGSTPLVSNNPRFAKEHCFWKVPRIRSFFLLVRATCNWDECGALVEWYWSVGGMILTGENWSTGTETCAIATWSVTGLTWTVLGPNRGFCSERPTTNRPKSGTVWKNTMISLNCIKKFSPYHAENTLRLYYKN